MFQFKAGKHFLKNTNVLPDLAQQIQSASVYTQLTELHVSLSLCDVCTKSCTCFFVLFFMNNRVIRAAAEAVFIT